LDSDEQRTLIITFVGGLGSIVAAACIIGGAIAVARHAKNDLGYWGQTTGITLLFAAGLVWAVRHVPAPGAVSKVFKWLSILIVAYFVVSALLVWIGVAAGIH
jgi:hypothetical protein